MLVADWNTSPSAILRIDTDFVRKVFQRCAGASHSTMDKLWLGYEQFEKSQAGSLRRSASCFSNFNCFNCQCDLLVFDRGELERNGVNVFIVETYVYI